MCFSATASYSASVVLLGAGAYAFHLSGRLKSPWWRLWALVPVLFGVQQALEGRVWQALAAGESGEAIPFALGFHCFSHFLWPWWLPLASSMVEPGKIRRRLFGGCAIFGIFAGTLVISVMMLHPEWMSVAMKEHSITYHFYTPWRSDINLPIKPAALYALIILVPLLFSSHKQIRIFGWLAALSSLFTSAVYEYAYVSVWCFFAAVLSLYLVYMIHQLAERKVAFE